MENEIKEFFRQTAPKPADPTSFTLELNADEAIFTTRGWGHRVGMSQSGAAAMAREGADYLEILKWYYQGVRIKPAE
jgi:stage II sporulation protein D